MNTLDVVIDEGGLALVGVDRFLIRQRGTVLHRSVDHLLWALAIAVQTIVAPAKSHQCVTFDTRHKVGQIVFHRLKKQCKVWRSAGSEIYLMPGRISLLLFAKMLIKAVTLCARPLFIFDVDVFIVALGRWVS